MKKLSLIILFAGISFGLMAQTSGGPDSYGYTWKNSNHATNPPTFNWIDISTRGTLVTGLADDNIVGPFTLNTPFHYYWYNVNKIWIGSNGYISFKGDNIASPFPANIPLSSGANNWIAPLMADLIFTGSGNTAKCYYYANTDSICISYVDLPFWENTSTGYTGSNSFQVILSRLDSSITFNYLKTDKGNVVTIDDAVGMENVSGTLGLLNYLDVLPPDTFTIKFYYPKTVTYAVTDGGVNWNINPKNGGIFHKLKVLPLSTNIRNFGNQNIGNIVVRDTLYNFSGTAITSGTKTIYSLPVNSDTTFTFTNTFTPATTGIYKFNTRLNAITYDSNKANDYLAQEIIVVDTSTATITLEYSDGTSEAGLGWNGGNGGVGVYIEPPFYPAKIVSSRFYIRANATPAVGFYAIIYDDDGPNGTKGTRLDSVYVAPGTITTGSYKTVTPAASNLLIQSGGVYLLWKMEAAGINIGKDLTPPFSRRTYEVLFDAWADYRDVLTEDFLMGINIEALWPYADFMASSGQDPKIVFTDQSTKTPTSWQWNFGDGSATDTTQNPSHTYTVNGSFQVCLTVRNSAGSSTKCKSVQVLKVPPVADFAADTTLDPKIIFSDSTTNSPTSWKWTFGELGASSTIKNPQYTYKYNGYHQVCLISTNAGGSDTICKGINIRNAVPITGFTADISLEPQVSFTDTSINNPISWKWNFGDLTTSLQQNPTHTFTSNGTFSVCLKTTNAGGSDSICKSIQITKVPPVANFSIDSSSNPYFKFFDISLNSPTSRLWDLDEKGITTPAKNPVYTFTVCGEHNICLRVTNAGGSDTLCKKIFVRKLKPKADFIADTTSDPTIILSDLSNCDPTSWRWNFNDNSPFSLVQNPTHTFLTNGIHKICLRATNSYGVDSICKNVLIRNIKPASDFSFDISKDPEVSFTDKSANNPISWHWDFDDNGATSTDQNPKYTFSKNGDFNVCLIATNAGGSDTICKKISIVKVSPLADFSINSAADPLISFTDNSTNIPLTWYWDFDDSTTSTSQNPSHSFKHNGSYQVCLKVTNAGGSDSICKTVTISKVIPSANFTYDSANMPLITFTDLSTENPTKWSWDFDDTGNDTTAMQNPSYTFITNGTHQVCLIASNLGGNSAPFCLDVAISGISINDKRLTKTLLIYPNPFTESAIIKILSDKPYSKLKMKCYNSLGQEVNISYSVQNNQIELYREKMSVGYYFIEIFNQSDPIGRGVIIVQ